MKTPNIPRVLAPLSIAASAALLGGVLVSGPVAAATPSTTRATSSSASTPLDACAASTPTSTSTTSTVAGSSVRATVKTFSDAGVQVTERLAPSGWAPATATAAELQYFGIPAKPTDPTALLAWTNEWVTHFTGFGDAIPCGPVAGNSATHTPDEIWSGIVAEPTSNNATNAHGDTAYYAPTLCSGDSNQSWTNWVGLGGRLSGRLLQNGFWTSSANGVRSDYPFWEMINGSEDTHTQMVLLQKPGGGSVVGDSFALAVDYGDYLPNQAQFTWHDLTTGTVFHMAAPSFDGHPSSYFYSGSSAEAIDERGTMNNVPARLSNYGTDHWFDVQATVGGTVTNMRQVPSREDLDIEPNSTVWSLYDAPADLSESADVWKDCGGNGTGTT